jgi:hypothetical protein
MPVSGWILIAVAVVAVIAAVVVRSMLARRRSRRLQERFGPEDEHTLGEESSRLEAEAELAERKQRRDSLEIVPLDPDAREPYAESWKQCRRTSSTRRRRPWTRPTRS